jgi:hypothetical protein
MAKSLVSSYFLLGDDEAYDILKKVLNGYERFKHIDFSDVLIAYKISNSSRFVASVRKVPKAYAFLAPGKELVLTIFRPDWESVNYPLKVAIMYHELLHVGYSEKKDEYFLIKHDVEDFKELLEKLGFKYEKALDLVKEMKIF